MTVTPSHAMHSEKKQRKGLMKKTGESTEQQIVMCTAHPSRPEPTRDRSTWFPEKELQYLNTRQFLECIWPLHKYI